MSFKFQRSIFRFRQDLRLEDNLGLIQAIKESELILPIFIFDTDILSLGPTDDKRLAFLSDAVRQLDEQLKSRGPRLHITHGKSVEVLTQLIKEYNIQAIYCNKSYGYGSKTRDEEVQTLCDHVGIQFYKIKDFLLVDPEEIPQRKVFTPYSKLRYRQIENNPLEAQHTPANISILKHNGGSGIPTNISSGGHKYRPVISNHKPLENINLAQYEAQRNIPSIHGTSKLSPYIRFGLVSIRQVYQTFKDNKAFINELARREFRQHIAHYFPETWGLEFQEKRRRIKWSQDMQLFEKRCKGETGYPIVDAGMRQLQEENRMHGRVRMIVASFLTKDMLIDRRFGEQWFAKYLLDYDTNVNIGNRQWSASVGADPKPLRIFNPILQSQKFDPQADYILKYIPELRGQPIEAIHDPLTHQLNYHKPIVDHYINSKLAKEMYYSDIL